jgi:hypothetical protein
MTQRRDVWTPIAGILAAVTFAVGLIFSANSPGSKDTDAQVLAWYAAHSHRVGIIVGAFVLAFCGLFFLRFVSGLTQRLRTAEGGSGRVASTAFAGGVLFVAMLWAGGAALAAVPASETFGSNPPLKVADIARIMQSLGFGAILVFSAFAAIALIGATSIVSMRTGTLPAWFAWLGFVAIVALLFGVVFLPMIALPIWLIAAGVTLLRSRPEVETAPPT